MTRFWSRQASCDLQLADGHTLRIAFETRIPEWVPLGTPSMEIISDVTYRGFDVGEDPDDPEYGCDKGSDSPGGWDGIPESRFLILHDDFMDRRLRREIILSSSVHFEAIHHHGLTALVEILAEAEWTPLVHCEELVDAIVQAVCLFEQEPQIAPDPDDPEFVDYCELYVNPVYHGLLRLGTGGC